MAPAIRGSIKGVRAVVANSLEIGRNLDLAGIETNYHDQGSGDPVLLIHGSGPGVTAWANWRTVLPRLAQTHRAIAPDMAGFGYTRAPDDFPPTPEFWVAQVLRLLDALGVERANVIGNSFGGAIALHLAHRHPERVQRLLLMGSAGISFPISTGLEKVWGYQPSLQAMHELLKIFAHDHSIITDDLVEMRYRASTRDNVQARFARLFPPPRQQGVDMLALSDAELACISAPVALVHGRGDRVIPFAVSEALSRRLPAATLYPIDECGHWVQIEKGERFLEIVTRFLESEAAPSM